MSFTEIVEEMYSLTFDEKVELKYILERDLLDEREEELLQNVEEAKKLEAAGKLPFYNSAEDFMTALKKS